jgi:hypothetical protein
VAALRDEGRYSERGWLRRPPRVRFDFAEVTYGNKPSNRTFKRPINRTLNSPFNARGGIPPT